MRLSAAWILADRRFDILENLGIGHAYEITVLCTKLRYREKTFFMSPPPGLPRQGGGGLLPAPGGRD